LLFKKYHHAQTCLLVLNLLLLVDVGIFAQRAPSKMKAAGRRLSFTAARALLTGEAEGNLSSQPNKFTRTRLSNGQVLELHYPITTLNPTRRNKTATIPGHGVLYESEAAYKQTTVVRHLLEDLIPDGRGFLDKVPQLVARLERRLGIGAGRLDYSRASLRRIDAYIAGYQRTHTTAQTDAQLFQELTAYYGETLRRATSGEWRIRQERASSTQMQAEPNIALTIGKEIKPWSSVLTALYDEERRGIGLTKVFDADVKAAQ
jgi:hypothetical protein